jgi:hypothetical protein
MRDITASALSTDIPDLQLISYELGRVRLDEISNLDSFVQTLEWIAESATKAFTRSSRTIDQCWDHHAWDEAARNYAVAIRHFIIMNEDQPSDTNLEQMALEAIEKV